jgi:Tfp pilus assembly protein PilW
VEVLVATALAAVVAAGVMNSFLMLGRSGVNIAAYSRMEMQARRSLEELSQDLRMASGLTWNSATSITLTVPNNYTSTANKVTYAYDHTSVGATAKSFYRMPGTAGAANPKTVLIDNITTFAYARFDRMDNAAAQDASTKRIQLTMTARTANRTAVDATNNILSASYILRNKPVN